MSNKERLDILLVNRGLFESREKAKAAIMAGLVFMDTTRIDKAGTKVPIEANLVVKGNTLSYVSRGGLKLEKALQIYPIDLDGAVMIDIGASTGGFTDCALQNGASKVFAIDVGYNQLAWKLRQDNRVINMEKQNIRTVTPEQLGELVDFISIDVAFISLDKVLPVATTLLKDTGSLVALIKPQFEAGKENVGKGGIVRDPAIHKEVLHRILQVAYDCHLYLQGLTFSPIKGMEGNIEFLGYFAKDKDSALPLSDVLIDAVVEEAHSL
ncbi:TlyA family RNA methyltransferase [Veillonella agrestimuris]|uniref:TlyA family RNA methyltransferase n=1 Tax=Veillonella agrestimuris TaxID=2941340 RepID=UPI00203CA02C|nr:TlyA family RNA methyltransferase [Veillonella agrestimuris]